MQRTIAEPNIIRRVMMKEYTKEEKEKTRKWFIDNREYVKQQCIHLLDEEHFNTYMTVLNEALAGHAGKTLEQLTTVITTFLASYVEAEDMYAKLLDKYKDELNTVLAYAKIVDKQKDKLKIHREIEKELHRLKSSIRSEKLLKCLDELVTKEN